MRLVLRHIVLISCFLVGLTVLRAQDAKTYLDRINANYLNLTAMELTLDYQLFRGHKGTEVLDSYANVMHLTPTGSHRKVYTDEVVTSDSLMLVLDHEFKTMQLSTYTPASIAFVDEKLKNNLTNCEDIIVREKDNGLRTIQLTFKEKSTVPYSLVRVTIDKDYWIKHITFYYATQLDFSQNTFNPDYDFPRLEVTYTALKKNWKDKKGITSLTNYIALTDGVYRPTALYKDYKLIDIRR